MDFNPFGDPSSGLLFEWKELEKLCNDIVELKNMDKDNDNNNVNDNVDSSTDGINNINKSIENNNDSPIQETEIDFEFRIINHQRETFSSTAGSSRGPIDVTLAPDFHKFMEICKKQNKDEDDS